jgi:hypothetical protein
MGLRLLAICLCHGVSGCRVTVDEARVPEGPRLELGQCEFIGRTTTQSSNHCRAYLEPDGSAVLELAKPYKVFQVRFVRHELALGTEHEFESTVDCTPQPVVTRGDRTEALTYVWYAVGTSNFPIRRETGTAQGVLAIQTMDDRGVEGSVSVEWRAKYDEPERLKTGIRFRLPWQASPTRRRDRARCYYHHAPNVEPRHWRWHDAGYCSPNTREVERQAEAIP